MITLTPTVDEFPALVRILVDLADSVYDVSTTTDTPQLGLVIPEQLYDRLQTYLELSTEPEPPLPVRKKRSPK